MTNVPVYGGPTKASIIQGAFGYLGQSAVAGYGLDTDEMATGLSIMDGMLAEWLQAYQIGLGYNFPNQETIGTGADESGIPAAAVEVVKQQLAMRLGPAIGKPMQPSKYMAEAWQNLRLAYSTVPEMRLNNTTIRGAGNRRWAGRRSPYFQTVPLCAELPAPFGYPTE